MQETHVPLGRLIDRLGTAVLLVVAVGAMTGGALFQVFGGGVDRMLHSYRFVDAGQREALWVHIDFVAIPLAAIAAVWLRWGADWSAGPREISARPRWDGVGTAPPEASLARPLLPLLGAVVLFGVFWYWGWWGYNPHYLFGVHPQFGVQRWISVALMAGVGYFGMILFPRLTASMAGAVAGPTLFAVVGYTLFPSFIEAASSRNTITDAEARLADMLALVFAWGALAVAIAAILTMLLFKRLRQRPLSYALWTGALLLCMAVSGTFNGSYPGR